jgi:hypothetical protein
MERKSFMVYMTWEEQVDLMEDAELRRFIKNLFRFHKGEDVELPSRTEKLTWLGIQPALITNWDKYEQKVAAGKENGKKGGAPLGNQNASKSKTTQNNPNNPIKDKREQITGKSKKLKEKREKTNDNGKLENGNQKLEKEEIEQSTDFTGTSTSQYFCEYTGTCLLKQEIDDINQLINTRFKDAQPEGKDTMFKSYVKELLQQKILSTGYFKSELFDYFNPRYINSIKQRLEPEQYEIVEPLLAEYNKLVYNS